MNEFKALREATETRDQEWRGDTPLSLLFRATELAGEVGELCNIVKKLEREKLGLSGSRASRAQLADELADVVLCADLFAMEAGIDLYSAVREKFNAHSEKLKLKTRIA